MKLSDIFGRSRNKETGIDEADEKDVAFHDILLEELEEIENSRACRHPDGMPIVTAEQFRGQDNYKALDEQGKRTRVRQKANELNLVGLAFSGGGVRSATFNLGVLQALAKYHLLPRIDYLSTVSGGGYIGAWLITWIKRECAAHAAGGTGVQPVEAVAAELAGKSRQVTYLRSFSSYLTPKSGLFSLDTWTLPATYLRNVVLNLTVLVLALSAVMVLPRMLSVLMEQVYAIGQGLDSAAPLSADRLFVVTAVGFSGLFCAFLVIQSIVENFRWASRDAAGGERAPSYTELPSVQVRIVLPLFAAAFLLVMGIRLAADTPDWRAGGAVGLALVLGAMALWAALQYIASDTKGLGADAAAKVKWKRIGIAIRRASFVTLGGLVGSGVLYSVAPYVRDGFPSPAEALKWLTPGQAALVWGIPLANVIFSLAATFYIGFMRNEMDTFQREWWARLGALVLMYSLAWAGLFLVALGSGKFLAQVQSYPWVERLLASGWLASTISGVVLGHSSQTGGASSGPVREGVLKVAPYVFVLGLLVLVSKLSEQIVYATGGYAAHATGVKTLPWWEALLAMLAVVVVLSAVACFISWRVEINHFSMHNFYRNRLVRAYVGASKEERNFHPFTGFDPDEDNVRIADMVRNPPLDPKPGAKDPKQQRRGAFSYVPTASAAGAGAAVGAAQGAATQGAATTGGAVTAEPAARVAPAVSAARAATAEEGTPGEAAIQEAEIPKDAVARGEDEATDNDKELEKDTGTDKDQGTDKVNPGYIGPYPIMNAALNLVSGKNLAWQKRKARSFVFTPLYSGYDVMVGSDFVLEKPRPTKIRPWQKYTMVELEKNAYRPTKGYLGGFSLGTAMAISGAAASPNMGYHSTPAIGFLMTVFNVRLGWWLGNPRSKHTWYEPGPGLGLFYLFFELFGLTNEERGYVYLSDGGHFDNLGIYELVQRGCRFIIACDAEEDPGLQFDGLGNAIEKCRTDFGVSIDINVDPIRLTKTEPANGRHCAVGTIDYGPGFEKGTLLYIKATLTGDEPADVIRYKDQKAAFPHQSTADQWFDETQFESYRILGQHVLEAVLDTVAERDEMTSMRTEEFFVKLRRLWYPPSQAVEESFTRHAEEFQKIMDEMRNSNELRFLDSQISPGLGKAVQSAGLRRVPDDYANWVPTEYTKLRAGYYMCSRMIQLMENVFLDLNLSLEYDHPDNQGWMNLFQRWSGSGMFQVTWAISAPIYGARFREFCRRRLGMERGTVGFENAIKVKRGDKTPAVSEQLKRDGADALNPFDAFVLSKLLAEPEFEGKPLLVYPLQVSVEKPDRTGTISGDIGFAVVSSKSEGADDFKPGQLACLWIQEHIRGTSLGRNALGVLIKKDKVDGVLDWIPDSKPRDIKDGERVLMTIDLQRSRAFYRSVENESGKRRGGGAMTIS